MPFCVRRQGRHSDAPEAPANTTMPNSDFKLFPRVKQKFNNLFYFQKFAVNFSEFSEFSAWSHQLRNYLKYFQCKSQYQVQSGPKMAQLPQISPSEKWKTSFLQDESKIEDILQFFPVRNH